MAPIIVLLDKYWSMCHGKEVRDVGLMNLHLSLHLGKRCPILFLYWINNGQIWLHVKSFEIEPNRVIGLDLVTMLK